MIKLIEKITETKEFFSISKFLKLNKNVTDNNDRAVFGNFKIEEGKYLFKGIST